MTKHIRYIIISSLVLLALAIAYRSAGQKTKASVLSRTGQAVLEQKATEIYQNKLMECLDDIKELASQMVDSTIVEQALFIGSDTLMKPIKPDRPYPENFEPPNKNIPLKPFLKKSDFINPFLLADSLRQDSIRLDSLIKIQTQQQHE